MIRRSFVFLPSIGRATEKRIWSRGATTWNEFLSINSIAGFNAGATALLAATAVTAAHTGTAARDPANDTYSAALKCRDPNGETFMVTINRDRVNLTSYSDDGIRTKVETWADSVAALA